MGTGHVARHATKDSGNSATAKQIMSPRGRTNDVRLQHAQEVGEASLDTPPPYDKLELAITKTWKLLGDVSSREDNLTCPSELKLRPAHRSAEDAFQPT